MNLERIESYIEEHGLNKTSRTQTKTFQRQYLMAKLHESGEFSLTEIGRMFNRHHATVIHGIKQHRNLVSDAYYKRLIHPAATMLNDSTLNYNEPKRNIFDDIEKVTNMDKLRRIKKFIKEGRYENIL